MPLIRHSAGRQFYRWYFYDPAQPLDSQTKGIPVTLMRDSWFGGELGFAVVKDMSMGGCGILVSSSDQIPQRCWVQYDKDVKVRALVRYRKKVNDKLEFLGLEWMGRDQATRLNLLRKLRRRAFILKQNHFRLGSVNQRRKRPFQAE